MRHDVLVLHSANQPLDYSSIRCNAFFFGLSACLVAQLAVEGTLRNYYHSSNANALSISHVQMGISLWAMFGYTTTT